ncbi:sorting and assembly machinery component 50 homolog [Liolophura sinensis]|uniref:sorting and assembly machinery component 50 homolog n=1 Tax=Liolophura sinensis TaxID=3198878 RepID=UPI0031598D55
MGTVHAKELEMGDPGMEPEVLDFRKLSAKVERVIIDGLGRTKDDLIVKQVKDIFQADNFQEMIRRTHEVKLRLERLGIFKHVAIFVDTSKGPDAKPNGYEVIFEVQELRRVAGGISTLIGHNDASVLFNLRLPNVFGRAEKVQMEYTHGTKQNRGYNLFVSKPLGGNPDIVLSSGVYQGHGEYPWSGYKETDRGVSVDLTFPSFLGAHCVKWEGMWRDLRALSPTTSFAVREQSGHSVKSSFKHILVRDKRDDPVLPSRGTLLRLVQEYAGVGGNVEFVKHDLEFQINQSLIWDTVVQLSLAGGIMKSLDPTKDLRVNDRFMLGGPLTLRGFNLKGVGPHSDGNALGADTYWLCAFHMYTPLPFRPGKGGFGELFRSHFFINAGNLGNLNFDGSLKEKVLELGEALRWSYGGGVVLRMGRVARLELNYVIPMQVQRGDSLNPGVQFGIGLSFL